MSHWPPDIHELNIVDPDKFMNPNPVYLAKDLVGQFLISEKGGVQTGGRIVETEAYKAPEDKACHAHLNRFTKRTSVMFAKGGRSYVYLCYGIHHLFNIVTGPKGAAHAILIRAIEPLWGLDHQAERRAGLSKKQWTSGPGKLTKALGISRDDNNEALNTQNAKIYICDNPKRPGKVLAAPRIGIGYAEECTSWPWRFLDPDSEFISAPP